MLNIRLDIGYPQGGWGNTAVVIQDYKDFLSHNSYSYWAYLPKQSIELRIAKDTEEGKAITNAINVGSPNLVIEGILLTAALKRLTVTQFKDIMDDQYDRGFKFGKNAIRETFACLMTPE